VQNLKEFERPQSLDEAVEKISAKPGRRLLAGGTGLSITDSKTTIGLVDLKSVGLDYIEDDSDAIKIGATAVMRALEESSLLQNYAGGLLADVAAEVGTTPLRNMITAGGNITQLRVWSDLPAPLLALDAEILVTDQEGETTYPAQKFFHRHPSQLLDDTDIVTEIQLPRGIENYSSSYTKFVAVDDSYAVTSVSVVLDMEGDTVKDVRIGVGSASPSPARCPEAEEELVDAELNESLAEKVGEICRANVNTTDNVWGSGDYKSKLIEKLVKKNLLQAKTS